MNIIYARMAGYDWVSTPSDAVARELNNLGHKITIVDNPNYIPLGEYDFVWSPYESVTILGDILSKKMEIPHYSHIEWFPPWRIFPDCNYASYGLSSNHPDIVNIKKISQDYQLIGKAFLNAKVKTIGSAHFIDYHKKFLNNNLGDILVEYPCADFDTLEKVKKIYNVPKIKNRVISIARLVPNKRFDLLVDVMNKVTGNVEWCIVGQGDEIDKIRIKLDNSKVKLNYIGQKWGWSKLYELMKSSIFLGSWTGIPPVEAAFLNVLPIVYEQKETNEVKGSIASELFGNFIPIFNEKEGPKNVSELISDIIKNNKDNTKVNQNFINEIIENKTGIKTAKQRAKNMVNIFNQHK